MTNVPDRTSLQGVMDWLESELRQLKTQLREYSDQADQNQTQLWDLRDQQQRSEHGASNLAAQINLLSALPEELRVLRERVERLQGAVGHDGEQRELFARQLRSEMQAERDERGELRRRTEFAEQTAATLVEKLGLAEDLSRRVHDETALMSQRLEQIDINLQGVEARLAASAEALRRTQGDQRNQVQEGERRDRALGELEERQERAQEALRRLQEEMGRIAETSQEYEALRERFEAVRESQDATVERANDMARQTETMQARFTEMERGLERARARADQQDRTLNELRHLVDEATEVARREAERFLGFQEKVRRRQVSDLEQELREIRAFNRQKGPAPDA